MIELAITIAVGIILVPLILYVVVLACVALFAAVWLPICMVLAPIGLLAPLFRQIKFEKKKAQPLQDRSHRKGFFTIEQMDRGEHLQ
jgi:hypothetical protein